MPREVRPQILRGREITSVDRGSGIGSVPYIGKWNSSVSSFTTGMTEIPEGRGIVLHWHNVEESVLILEGLATAEIGEQSEDLQVGDVTWVPKGVPHRFSNRGSGVLRIYWVYAGLYVTRTIASTGETVEHLSVQDRNDSGNG